MAKDIKGRKIKVGDTVNLKCTITGIVPSTKHDELVGLRPTHGTYDGIDICVRAAQVKKTSAKN